ncbi:MAG: glycosyltransferase family 2 protein [Verrucomicrobia bacterium]|nr:glycosyltransferase family 2 protein [Verrucomicrobiota bacterium]
MKKWFYLFFLLFSTTLFCTPKPQILVGSPIRQKPAILKEFLESLDRIEGCALDFVFVDDNDSEESREQLYNFAKNHEGHCWIFSPEAPSISQYHCNETTHYWSDENVWKVAAFKDRIIHYATQKNYDYLFLIDSDIVLHPTTVQHLVQLDKEIVSEIFWTRWNPQSIPLPQVWLYDQYTLIESTAGEKLSDEEINKRVLDFVAKLKRPGVYEVGGLGACTLISKSALQKGVRFKKIPNITFWGEDRHFCIRAASLGIPLHVDTHYPAYHIYRESNLETVPAFKRQCDQNRPRLTLGMCVKNEANRYLRQVLEKASHYITNAIIIDDASTDNTPDVCREALQEIPLRLIQNTESKFSNEITLRKQLWEEIIKTDPDWILILDADEIFEDQFEQHLTELLRNPDVDAYAFRLYDFWDETHYRDDPLWNAHTRYIPFLVRYRPELSYQWRETPLHCGRFPMSIYHLRTLSSPLRLKHLGWAKEEDRLEKYKRYQQLDPQAIWGIKAQYDSILDPSPHLAKWEESD